MYSITKKQWNNSSSSSNAFSNNINSSQHLLPNNISNNQTKKKSKKKKSNRIAPISSSNEVIESYNMNSSINEIGNNENHQEQINIENDEYTNLIPQTLSDENTGIELTTITSNRRNNNNPNVLEYLNSADTIVGLRNQEEEVDNMGESDEMPLLPATNTNEDNTTNNIDNILNNTNPSAATVAVTDSLGIHKRKRVILADMLRFLLLGLPG